MIKVKGHSRFLKQEYIKQFWKKRVFDPENIFWLIKKKVTNLFIGIAYFVYEIISSPLIYIKLIKIRGIKKNKEVLIIAGGPSSNRLNVKDLEKFQKKNDIFFVNYFCLNKKFKKIIPNYQVISDPNTLKLKKNIMLNASRQMQRIQILKKFISSNKTLKVFIPIKYTKTLSAIINHNRIFGFCDSDLSYIYNFTAPVLPRGYLSSTSFKAMAIASWMGYKKQYIIGLDHSYINNLRTDSNNEIFQVETHSYEKNKLHDYTDCYGDLSDYVYGEYRLLYHLKRLTIKKEIYNLDNYSYTPGLKKIKSKKFKLN
jgi:hypothetical protein